MTTTLNKTGLTEVTVKVQLGRSSYTYTLHRGKGIKFSGSKNHEGPANYYVGEFYEAVFTHARRL
jgi:hypothetical protein